MIMRCVVGGASSAVGSGGQPTMANGGAPGKTSSGGGGEHLYELLLT